MCTNKIKNVLVLGTGSVNVVRFCKLYETYLSYDSYGEAKMWRPDLSELKYEMRDDEDPVIFINNLRLICTPHLSDSCISKQIISILSNFEEQQSLSAIIILLKQNEEDNVHLSKLKRVLFGDFKKIEDNILYVYAGQKNLLDINNKMYFNERTFFALTNWSEDTKFCKSIYDYIVDDGNKNGLETVHVRCGISKELILNLIDSSMQLILYICMSSFSFPFYINGFKRNVTVCYGNQCVDRKNVGDIHVLTPKICHNSCSCTDGNTDVTKCLIFETENKTCVQCNCKKECHSHDYFKWAQMSQSDIYLQIVCEEEQIAINILAAFYLFKQQNKQEMDIHDIFKKYVEIKDPNYFNTLQQDMYKQLIKLQRKSSPVTNKDMLLKLKEMYEIKYSATIVPKFIEEIFPQDFRFKNACVPTTPQTISRSELPYSVVHKQLPSSNSKAQANPAPSKTTKLKEMQNATNMDDIKMEMQTLKNKVSALERTIKNLISGMDDIRKEIINGKLKQDEQSSSN